MPANGGWSVRLVADCFESLALPGKAKVLARDYKKEGRFPVVDQGQERIAGWTNDEAAVIDAPLPLVIFGDHTRVLKFIDTPFARGADGTQILRPHEDIDPLFFFFACRSLSIPSRGYNRHFSLLKEQEISVPNDKAEQEAIGRVLRLLEARAEQQDTLEATARRLKSAAMRELFTRGLRGEPQKETEIGPVPESWEETPIGELGKVVTGTTPPTKRREFYDGGEVPFIAPGDFEHGNAIVSTQKLITHAGVAVSRPLRIDSTCVVCIGSSIGKVGITTAPISTTNQQINAIEAGGGFIPRYVFHLLTYYSDHIRAQASPSPVPILSKGAFEQIAVYASRDRDEQHQISSILDAIDRKIDLHRRKRAVLEELFKSLLHKLMTGEVRVSDLDLSALPASTGPSPAAQGLDGAREGRYE